MYGNLDFGPLGYLVFSYFVLSFPAILYSGYKIFMFLYQNINISFGN